ncbi:MAG: SAM-dependent DNA methyltransferase [Bradymonadales bacterium]|nr:SAM-dependent DNA methyltransferase [Bradymonadales bacterium]
MSRPPSPAELQNSRGSSGIPAPASVRESPGEPDAGLVERLSAARRRELGCFLTPWPIARLMAWMLVRGLTGSGALIDPAAGTGRLLVSLAERLDTDRSASNGAFTLCGVELQPELADWTGCLLEQRLGPGRSVILDADALELLLPERRMALLGHRQFAGVIANPPYVREKLHRELFARVLEAVPEWRRFFSARQDLQQLFGILGLHLLQPGGELVYLTNSYWLHSDSGQKLRRLIQQQAEWLAVVDFGEMTLFPEAKGQHSILVHLRDRRKPDRPVRESFLIRVTRPVEGGLAALCQSLITALSGGPDVEYLEVTRGKSLLEEGSRGRLYLPGKADALISRIQSSAVRLGQYFSTRQGIISGADRVSPANRCWVPDSIATGSGIFVLSPQEVEELELCDRERRWLVPIYRARQIRPFTIIGEEAGPSFLLNLDGDLELDEVPAIKRHLERFRSLLERRREVRSGRIRWFQLHWPRERALFDRPRIATPRRAPTPRFAMGLMGYCEQSDVALITSPRDDVRCLEALLVVLNSGLVGQWVAHRGKQKGAIREFFGRALEEIPLPKALAEQPERFVELAQFAGGKEQERAERCVARLYGL